MVAFFIICSGSTPRNLSVIYTYIVSVTFLKKGPQEVSFLLECMPGYMNATLQSLYHSVPLLSGDLRQ